ncbi:MULTISPECIES: helix-turn-helix domain-containing protein [Enterobacteriaceae]|uniref:AraC family transcriptional regulator n=1 Tax=Raoultella lignicola TaxID=3040939 RepID=A0ABU9F9T9_9ENTR|nr:MULTISPECIES: AraC family transcriptional regulator [Enterobacteriaceae]MRT48483.1 AraC family transcriptional regulator [Raoultella sp. RIT712]QNK09187.1 helix-turn-helix transcriptional regulator [Enterobacter sp. JUb54]ROS15562.1 AraC family transcriptional regulator [Raoultella sp. BIGb0399]
MAYGTFETLRRQNAVLRETVELNSGIQLAAWYNNLDTVTVRSNHHTLSLYVADGYESYQKTPQGWKNGGGPDRFCLMPKGAESTWDIRGDLSFVHLYCTDEHLRKVGEQIWDRSPASFSLQEQTFSQDDKITAVYRQFLLDYDWQQQANQLMLSSASTLLLTHLIQHYSNVQWRLPTVSGGLAPHVLRNLLARIEEQLDQPLTLADLAQEAALSEYHFARMFRQSMNMAPHQYVMQRRMIKAQELICRSTQSLTEIAMACGFSSASHFSNRVKSATGLTPSQLRAAQR